MTPSSSVLGTPKSRPYFLVLLTFLVIEATGVFENVMMIISLPTLMREFDMGIQTMSWTITIFLLVGAGTVTVSGRLGDLYGHRKVLLILLAVSAAGPLISAANGTYEGILVGRALQGTSAALFPLLVALAREVVPAMRVPVLVSVTAASAALTGAIGGFVAGLMIDLSSWRFLFLASGVLAIIAFAIGSIVLPKPDLALVAQTVPAGSRPRIDYVGALLPLPSIAALLYGIEVARNGSIGLVILLVAVGFVLGAFWIVYELRTPEPMFNLRLFKIRSLKLVFATSALVSVGAFGGFSLMQPILLQSPLAMPVGLGLSATEAGAFGLVTGILGFILSPFAGRVSARSGARKILLIGVGCKAVSVVGFAVSIHNLPLAAVTLVVAGVSTSFVLSGISNLIVEIVDPEHTGEAVAMVYGAARTLFMAVGTALCGGLLTVSTVSGGTEPTLTSWYIALGFIGATLLFAILATYMIRTGKTMAERGDVIEGAVSTDVTQSPGDSAQSDADSSQSVQERFR